MFNKAEYAAARRQQKNFQGGGGTKKKDRKIALLSLYLLYLYHV